MNIDIRLAIMGNFMYAGKSKVVDNACSIMYKYVLSNMDILIGHHG